MKFGNFIWFLLFGLVTGLIWFVVGVVFCATLVGIPFGKQCFKHAGLCFFPFGKAVDTDFDSHPIGNFLFLVLGGGFISTVLAFVLGLVFSVTLIGIPFGKQFFKISKLSRAPFGARVFK